MYLFFFFNFQIGTVVVPWPHGGLYPIIGLHSDGEEVELHLDSHWNHDDVILMAVDNVDDEWSRLHQVRLNGCVSDYFSPSLVVSSNIKLNFFLLHI